MVTISVSLMPCGLMVKNCLSMQWSAVTVTLKKICRRGTDTKRCRWGQTFLEQLMMGDYDD